MSPAGVPADKGLSKKNSSGLAAGAVPYPKSNNGGAHGSSMKAEL